MGCEKQSFTKSIQEIAKNLEPLLQSGKDAKEAKTLLTEATAINEAVRAEHIGLKSTINTDGELIITKEDTSFVEAVRLENGHLILTY